MAEVRSMENCRVAYQATAGRTKLMHKRTGDYDQTQATEVLGAFNHFVADVVSRYEANDRIRLECDQQTQDLLHFIELQDDMNASDGYKIYRKLAEVRRTRRVCKNENELLSAMYGFIQQNPKLVSELPIVLGKTRTAKECIENRLYSARTDII